MLEQLGEVSAAMRVEEARALGRSRWRRSATAASRSMSSSRVGAPGEIVAAVATERERGARSSSARTATPASRGSCSAASPTAICATRRATCSCAAVRRRTRRSRSRSSRPTSRPRRDRALRHVVELTAPDAPIEVVHAWQLPAGSWGASLLGQARFPWSTVRDAVLTSAKAQADKLVAATRRVSAIRSTSSSSRAPPASVDHATPPSAAATI